VTLRSFRPISSTFSSIIHDCSRPYTDQKRKPHKRATIPTYDCINIQYILHLRCQFFVIYNTVQYSRRRPEYTSLHCQGGSSATEYNDILTSIACTQHTLHKGKPALCACRLCPHSACVVLRARSNTATWQRRGYASYVDLASPYLSSPTGSVACHSDGLLELILVPRLITIKTYKRRSSSVTPQAEVGHEQLENAYCRGVAVSPAISKAVHNLVV
jgi:hypothetical protein